MQFTVTLSDEGLNQLADLIASRLSGHVIPVQNQSAAQQPMNMPPAMPQSQATYTPPPPAGPPPQMAGNVRVFAPGTGHITQASGHRELMPLRTGQSVQAPVVRAPTGVNIPVVQSNVPSGVPPQMNTPTSPQLSTQMSGEAVKKLAMAVFIESPNGQSVVNHALATSGVNHFTNLNDSNAGQLYAALKQLGVPG